MADTAAAHQDVPSAAAPPSAARPATAPQRHGVNGELERLLGLRVPLAVKLAERDMPIESILGLTVGSVLEFDQSVDGELELAVTDQPIGFGAAVKIGENFGLRISRIGTPGQRIRAMGR